MAKQRVKNQHYVPQFYLRRFADKNEKLFAFDRASGRSFPAAVANVASTGHFYEIDPKLLPADAPFQLVEKALSQIEGSANAVIADVIDTLEKRDYLYPTQKVALAPFIALQAVRTNEFRLTSVESMEALAKRVAEAHLKLKFPEETDLNFEIKANEQVVRFQHAQSMFGELARDISHFLSEHVWIVARNTTAQPLFTSDAPVVRRAHVKHPILSFMGFASRGIEVAFPLSPKYILTMYDRAYHRKIHNDEFHVISMAPENVSYYNSLQVYQCTRQVYCPEDKFDLCHTMLKDHPELKDVDRDRVVINPKWDSAD